jgi:hypothetical protein
MQLIESVLSKKEYLASLKSQLDSPFHFFEERFCGFVLGKFFYVIHHSEHQWDRKYGSPKNAALGYVTENGQTSDVYFITFKGFLCPSQFFLTLLLCFLSGFVALLFAGVPQLIFSPLAIILLTVSLIISAPIHALCESYTERSTEGENALLSLLYDPKN